MALESPKIDICQNGPHGALGDVSSCLETKFDKEMSMGSVPNCRKEIANRYGIRWFKYKLKPPKKGKGATSKTVDEDDSSQASQASTSATDVDKSSHILEKQ